MESVTLSQIEDAGHTTISRTVTIQGDKQCSSAHEPTPQLLTLIAAATCHLPVFQSIDHDAPGSWKPPIRITTAKLGLHSVPRAQRAVIQVAFWRKVLVNAAREAVQSDEAPRAVGGVILVVLLQLAVLEDSKVRAQVQPVVRARVRGR